MQQRETDPHNFENDFGRGFFFVFNCVLALILHPILHLDRLTDLELLVQHVKFAKSLSDVELWKSTVVR